MRATTDIFGRPGASGAVRVGAVALGLLALGAGIGILAIVPRGAGAVPPIQQPTGGTVELPAPHHDGSISVEAALLRRRSIRAYHAEPLRLDEVAQLLWAAQGISDPATGARTAPSAGALYPLDVSIVAAEVAGLGPGVYRYHPSAHALTQLQPGDVRRELAGAALGQLPVRDAAAVILISGVYERTTVKYGDRGVRYVWMEAGHAAQNVYLQATALGLGTVVVGAFDDEAARRVAGLGEREQPLYLMPIGRR